MRELTNDASIKDFCRVFLTQLLTNYYTSRPIVREDEAPFSIP